MVALRVIVHTPYERVALAIPSTLYSSEATFFVQFLLQQHHSLDPIDTDTPQYVDVVSSSPWQLAHLTNGVLKEDRTLFDNGIRDGDVLLFERDMATEPVTHSAITDSPHSLDDKERLNELQQSSRRLSLITIGIWVLGCVISGFFSSWWSFGGVLGSLILLLAYTMVVIYQRGRADTSFLGWSALTMAAAGGFALPGANYGLSLSTRALIAVSMSLLTMILCQLIGTLSLKSEPFAALFGVFITVMVGLTITEYTPIPARSTASTGLLIASVLFLAAPRLALWIARVKIPLTALIDVDLPLLPQSVIDPELEKKLQRARWLQSVLTLSGAFLTVVCTVTLLGCPWTTPYDAPTVWQWILLGRIVISLVSASLHAVYRTQTPWLLGTVLVIFTAISVVAAALTNPLVGLVLILLCLLIFSALWLWSTQWNLTPLAQRIVEIMESVLLAIIFPIGIVATGLVSLLLTL